MAAAADAPPAGDGTAMPRSNRRHQNQSSSDVVIPTTEASGVRHPPPPNPAEEPSFIMKILQHVMLFILMQSMAGLVKSKFMPSQNNNNNSHNSNIRNDIIIPSDQQKGKPMGATTTTSDNRLPIMPPACLWAPGTVMDLTVLITDSPNVPIGWPPLTTMASTNTTQSIVDDDSSNASNGNILASWQQDGLILGGVLSNDDDDGGKPSILSAYLSSNADQTMNRRNATLTIPMTEAIWNNQTQIYGHVRLQRRRTFRDGTDSRDVEAINRFVRKDDVLIKRMTLTRYRKRKKNRDVKSLLDTPSSASVDSTAEEDAEASSDTSVLTMASRNKTHDQILLYMKPFVTLQLVDIGSISLPQKKNIPIQIAGHMDWYDGEEGVISDIEQQGDGRGFRGPNKQDLYYPILYQSEFWITSSSLKELNGTVTASKLDINVEPVPVRPCSSRLSFDNTITIVFSFSPITTLILLILSQRCGSGSCKVKHKTIGVNRNHSRAKKIRGMTCYATCSWKLIRIFWWLRQLCPFYTLCLIYWHSKMILASSRIKSPWKVSAYAL